MLSDPLSDLLVREAELFCQTAQAAGLFDGVKVRALKVFDQAEHQLFVVAGFAAHDCRHRGQSRQPGSSPAALTGDQLVAIGQPPHQDWLKHAVQADRFRQLAERFGVKTRAHLLVGRSNLIDRDHLRHQGIALARHWDQRLESAAETAHAWLAHRSSSSFASARYAAAPRHVGSYSITDLPWLGASLMRMLRGITVSRMSFG